MTDYERTTVRESTGSTGWTLLVRSVTLVFGIAQALLIIRIVLLLLGADHANEIVSAILGATDALVEPFRGMFRLDHITTGSASFLDIAAVVAMVGWTLIEALILAILRIADRRVPADV